MKLKLSTFQMNYIKHKYGASNYFTMNMKIKLGHHLSSGNVKYLFNKILLFCGLWWSVRWWLLSFGYKLYCNF